MPSGTGLFLRHEGKSLFNGDIGQIVKIDPVERGVVVRLNQQEVVYDHGKLDELALACAITIHKSQGSKFPVVIIPLAMQHYPAATEIRAL